MVVPRGEKLPTRPTEDRKAQAARLPACSGATFTTCASRLNTRGALILYRRTGVRRDVKTNAPAPLSVFGGPPLHGGRWKTSRGSNPIPSRCDAPNIRRPTKGSKPMVREGAIRLSEMAESSPILKRAERFAKPEVTAAGLVVARFSAWFMRSLKRHSDAEAG